MLHNQPGTQFDPVFTDISNTFCLNRILGIDDYYRIDLFQSVNIGRNLITFSIFLPVLHIPKNGIWIVVNKFYMVFV